VVVVVVSVPVVVVAIITNFRGPKRWKKIIPWTMRVGSSSSRRRRTTLSEVRPLQRYCTVRCGGMLEANTSVHDACVGLLSLSTDS
jgi:hypothetical protein